MIQDFKERLKSLDIETTGLDETRSKIWSIGLTGAGHSSEQFINPTSKKKWENVESEIIGKDSFQAKQVRAGSYDGLKNAIKDGRATSEAAAMSNLFKNIDKDSILVVQNVNFENKFIGEILNNHPDLPDIQEKMQYVTGGANQPGRILYTPPQVTSLRSQTNFEYAKFLNTGEGFENVSRLYTGIMDEYKKHMGTSGKGAFTIELMDVTKSTYAMAASQGFLDKKQINIGTSVEFLSQQLLGEVETHTALNDAEQQLKIFKKLMGIQDELASGNVSSETRKTLSNIKAAQPFETSRQFISALKNTLQEMSETIVDAGPGRTRLIDPNTTEGLKEISVYNKDGQRFGLTIPNYPSVPSTDDPAVAMEHVKYRFKNQRTAGINKFKIVEELKGKTSLDDMISHLEELEQGAKSRVSEEINIAQGKSSYSNIDQAKRKVTDFAAESSDWFSGLSKTQKGIGLGVVSSSALLAMASTSEEEAQEMQNAQKRAEEKQTLKSALDSYTFTEPTLYHGSGFADYKERKGHHRY